MLLLGDVFPDIKVHTNEGEMDMHEFIGNSWCILFSHPNDYTPVCTTELARAAQLSGEFAKRNVKPIGLSCNDIESHHGWIKDIQAYGNLDTTKPFPFPIIEDKARIIANKLGMIDPNEHDSAGIPLTARAVLSLSLCYLVQIIIYSLFVKVFVIGPDKKVKASILYPASTGRNFE